MNEWERILDQMDYGYFFKKILPSTSVINMPYSNQERTWIVEKYFETNNAHEVVRRWNTSFSSPAPTPKAVLSLVEKFKNTGSVQNIQRSRDSTVLTLENVNLVTNHVEENPHSSLRKTASLFGMSHESVRKALHQQGLYPYKAIHVQQLKSGDREKRLEFCSLFCYAHQQLQEQIRYIKLVQFS
jgi:Helix-turn-helix domain (DUF4817)